MIGGNGSRYVATLVLVVSCVLPEVSSRQSAGNSANAPTDQTATSVPAGDAGASASSEPQGAAAKAEVATSQGGVGGALAPASQVTSNAAGAQPSMPSGVIGSAPPELPDGTACNTGDACASQHCVDGHCCQTAGCAVCQQCGTRGVCDAVAGTEDLDSCSGGKRVCNSSGVCVSVNGEKCTSPRECESNACVDGTCCGSSNPSKG